MVTANEIEGLDPGIAHIVWVLQEAGVETFESCQGGDGHAFDRPTVRFDGTARCGHLALERAGPPLDLFEPKRLSKFGLGLVHAGADGTGRRVPRLGHGRIFGGGTPPTLQAGTGLVGRRLLGLTLGLRAQAPLAAPGRRGRPPPAAPARWRWPWGPPRDPVSDQETSRIRRSGPLNDHQGGPRHQRTCRSRRSKRLRRVLAGRLCGTPTTPSSGAATDIHRGYIRAIFPPPIRDR